MDGRTYQNIEAISPLKKVPKTASQKRYPNPTLQKISKDGMCVQMSHGTEIATNTAPTIAKKTKENWKGTQ